MREAGVVFEARSGADLTAEDWDFFYRCYQLTYRAHHSKPYLSRDFFARMASEMPGHWLMFTARRSGERVASSLVALDPQRRAAFGFVWGCDLAATAYPISRKKEPPYETAVLATSDAQISCSAS